MHSNEPNTGIPEDVLARYEDASQERMIAHLLQSFRDIHADRGEKLNDICMAKIGTGVLTLRELNAAAQKLELEPYIIFRTRILRATTDRVMESYNEL